MSAFETILSGRRGEVIGTGWGREEIVVTAIVALPSAAVSNADDDTGLFYVPAGFVVTGITASADDLDSATTNALRVDIGDADDENRLMAAADLSAAISSTLARAGHLYKYTAKTQIRAYVETAATTAAAGTLKVSLRGFVDPDFNTTALTAA